MIKQWAKDIRVKTKNMDRNAKVEYVLNYYWYHILLGALMIGLLILSVYHVSWGKKRTDFSMVIVNQDINYARDESIQTAFAQYAGLPAKQVQVDSDYLISYGDVRLQGINESSYEKFFFRWSAGSVDAVVMPQSFYTYCKEQNGTFVPLKDLQKEVQTREDLQKEVQEAETMQTQARTACFGRLLTDQKTAVGVYVEQTKLCEYFKQNEKDPYVLVFPMDMKHKKAAGRFLEYTLK